MIKVYTGIKGLAFLFFFVAGLVLFLSIISWGIAKAAALLLPLLIVLSYVLITVFLLGILPATFFKDLRPSLGMYSVLMSHALGVSTWMVAIGAMFKGFWPYAGHLALWISFTYGMRFYSQWVLNLNSRNRKSGDIIDVDVVEVRNS